ncbi:MAG: hypothetical protein A2W90_22600 [Bacteroidetes bacterium GWF2_42_66]|nr:MAG: hypothetical protein A2W92_22005 [Bacteroidetes bacterium GWA2_42_15]OFY03121.1 MAG: hypothetical protein A2W89_13380 [Bacteroidetes bacterium GWE2_42_39]OFY45229.1 MAG: hypothetical protein A2W90_22600 [Bacteroidetes bacterium GWF2_42_66]HBL74112.1 hypothetical protein [Prolixibacteraceae bacterium]HCR89529.1 hypothetical protein [Prolixibacteraceae bacterium]
MARLKKIAQRIGLRGLSTIVATLLAIPFAWGGLIGFYAWLSPFIMLNSVFLLKSVVWMNGVAFFVLIITFFRKRWFCRYLCPVGWSCDLVSSCSHRKNFSVQKIPPLGKWMALSSLVAAFAGIPLFILLDPMSVFNGFFAVFSGEMTIAAIISLLGLPILLAAHLFFPGIWCAKLCPLGGLQDEVVQLKKLINRNRIIESEPRQKADSGRRLFFASGLGLVAGLLLPRFLQSEKRNYICPPGSVPASIFDKLCLRCGNCIKACPTGILKHHTDSEDITAWMIPEICFDEGYCLENCNLCSRVCPSGAITLFSPDAKRQLPIGLAEVEIRDCLLIQQTECDRCKTACSYEAITIEAEGGTFQMIPIVDPEKCVGCGACAVICPPETISIIPSGAI